MPRAFPMVPALAGVATFVVAASGALTLQSVGGLTAASSTPDVLPAGGALSVGQFDDARRAAAGRTGRSDRPTATASPTATTPSAAQIRQMTAKERADWAAHQTRELELIRSKAQGVKDQYVFERVITWVLPVTNFRLSAGFGQSGSMWSSDHTGQDFAAPMGTPVRSVGAGEIISAHYSGPYGNRIIVRHDDGTETWYCHLSAFEHTGGRVRSGEVIGYVGSTGNSTGPHLHFEVRPGGGDPIDPLPWLRQLGLPI
jgi:murein DD-endopeptidase MepM/ murein hydrolase activator NlpD